MKKILFTCMLSFISLSALAGFIDNASPNLDLVNNITTVDKLSALPDDTFVTLKGRLLKSLNDEKYLFADNTGQIIVEIDEEDFNNLIITPQDLILIKGEVDKNLLTTTIDVQSLEKTF